MSIIDLPPHGDFPFQQYSIKGATLTRHQIDLRVIGVAEDEEQRFGPIQSFIACHGVREHHVECSVGVTVSVSDSDPLIWKYQYDEYAIYIDAPIYEPEKVFVALSEAHYLAVSHKIPFFRYFRRGAALFDHLRSACNLLAQGPAPLVLAYMRALDTLSVRAHVLDSRMKAVPTDAVIKPAFTRLRVLRLGETYVVAEWFDVTDEGGATQRCNTAEISEGAVSGSTVDRPTAL